MKENHSQISSSAFFFPHNCSRFIFRSWLTQTSLPFHLSTGRNAKPISSCISLIRDFNMCHPLGGQPPWHVHNTHKHTAPSWQLTPITGPPCRMACISAKSRSHVTPSSMPLVEGGKRGNHAGNRSSCTFTHIKGHTKKKKKGHTEVKRIDDEVF